MRRKQSVALELSAVFAAVLCVAIAHTSAAYGQAVFRVGPGQVSKASSFFRRRTVLGSRLARVLRRSRSRLGAAHQAGVQNAELGRLPVWRSRRPRRRHQNRLSLTVIRPGGCSFRIASFCAAVRGRSSGLWRGTLAAPGGCFLLNAEDLVATGVLL